MEFEEPRAAACEVELLAHAHQTPSTRRSLWVILDHPCGFRLPFDVCFSPKATYLPHGNEMTRRAIARSQLEMGGNK